MNEGRLQIEKDLIYIELQIQASQVQPESIPIDAANANKRHFQEIEDQSNFLF